MTTNALLLTFIANFLCGSHPGAEPQGGSAHRIGVRQTLGVGELYDTVTGETFLPRGTNYVRLTLQSDAWQPFPQVLYHNVFRVGEYDPGTVTTALARMRTDGHNTVRVFLNTQCLQGCIGTPQGGLRPAYVANVVDFLRLARDAGMYVVLTNDFSPRLDPYSSLSTSQCCAQFDGYNLQYLSAGGLAANRLFWNDFMAELLARNAPLETVLAFELRNELHFDSNQPPLSLATGMVTTANGMTYDMSDPAQKQAMMDDNLVYWIDDLRATIRAHDPDALVTCGFFTPQAPHPARPGDTRVIRTGPAIASSTADFIDLHTYPGVDLTLAQLVDNFEMAGHPEMPVVMGEFGAWKFAYSTPLDGALALGAWQAESCGFGFDGWLSWTWDTSEQPELWNALDGDEIVNRLLAPQARPDPCAGVPSGNLARGRPVTASAWVAGSEPELTVDGTTATGWSAGAFPPQWIEVDLEQPREVGRIRLTVSQFPDGNTVHRLLVRGPGAGDPWTQLVQFSGFTTALQVLEYTPPAALTDVRWVRVETDSSPSWVAWREIEVVPPELVGPGPASPTPIAPANGAVLATRSPELSWSADSQALTHHVQVARDAGFTRLVFESGTIPSTSLQLPDLGANAPYHWRVRSGNLAGTSPWSTAWTFTTQAPPRTTRKQL